MTKPKITDRIANWLLDRHISISFIGMMLLCSIILPKLIYADVPDSDKKGKIEAILLGVMGWLMYIIIGTIVYFCW